MVDEYLSKYSNNKMVSAAQYITEIICEHKALKDKKDLHYRFWLTKEWSVYYRNQIGSAHKLLKKYSSKAIVMALKDDGAQKIYSLRAPHLVDIIDKYQDIVDKENKTLSLDLDRSEKVTYRKNISGKNIISKLKDLENE